MIPSVGSTLSALRALGTKMEVTAHNAANLQSEGYRSRRALVVQGAGGGVEVDIEADAGAGDTPARGEPSNVDLAGELTGAALTSTVYQANLRVLDTEDEMKGYLLDVMG